MQLSKHTSSCYNTRVFLLTNGQSAGDYAVTKGPHQVEVFLNMPKDSKIKEVPEGNLSSKMSLKSRLHDTSCIQLDLWNLLFHSPCRATQYSLIYTTCIYPYHKSITFSCQTVTMSSADVVEIIVPLCIIYNSVQTTSTERTSGKKVGWLCWGLTSQSTIFQSCRDGAIASWVFNQYFRGVKCLAQGHNTAAVGLEPRTSRSGVRHSTTEPPRSPCGKKEVFGETMDPQVKHH